jgi:hypothetical protein
MNHSTGKPTKYEAERIEAMLKLGCLCCAQLGIWHIAECQHIVEGNRLGHWYTLPWCPGHHRGVWDEYQLEIIPKDLRVALSDGSKPFEKIYGTQRQQWEKVQRRLGLTAVWPSSKIVPRRVLGGNHDTTTNLLAAAEDAGEGSVGGPQGRLGVVEGRQ